MGLVWLGWIMIGARMYDAHCWLFLVLLLILCGKYRELVIAEYNRGCILFLVALLLAYKTARSDVLLVGRWGNYKRVAIDGYS